MAIYNNNGLFSLLAMSINLPLFFCLNLTFKNFLGTIYMGKWLRGHKTYYSSFLVIYNIFEKFQRFALEFFYKFLLLVENLDFF